MVTYTSITNFCFFIQVVKHVYYISLYERLKIWFCKDLTAIQCIGIVSLSDIWIKKITFLVTLKRTPKKVVCSQTSNVIMSNRLIHKSVDLKQKTEFCCRGTPLGSQTNFRQFSFFAMVLNLLWFQLSVTDFPP